MDIVIKPRGEGKTIQLINKAAESFSYIVCFSHEEASRVFSVAEQLGKDIPFPITMQELIDSRFHSPGINGFLIDNADMLLKMLAKGVPVECVSFTEGY